ncbi:hypothetical protein PROFUN_09476 [Planoprotostelium fungivorum]|uniref:Uncharacterized protein n=1 Tax=Planoprotostelium fungivorum TaxID=1890364 RepID=A0A2P6NH47_9EUKA|nr:hypothetical protein PROFUN_09476 [Planoprotostelium fungivorum]
MPEAPEKAIFSNCITKLGLRQETLERVKRISTGKNVQHGVRFESGHKEYNHTLKQLNQRALKKIITDQRVRVKIPNLYEEFRSVSGYMNGPSIVYWMESSLGRAEEPYEPTPIRNKQCGAQRVKRLPDIPKPLVVDATPPSEDQYSPQDTPTGSEDGSTEFVQFDQPSNGAATSQLSDSSYTQVHLEFMDQGKFPRSEIKNYNWLGSTGEDSRGPRGLSRCQSVYNSARRVIHDDQHRTPLSGHQGFISQCTLPLSVEMSMYLDSERDDTLIEELQEFYSSIKNMLDEAHEYHFPIKNWSTLEGPQTVEDILVKDMSTASKRGDERSRLSMSHGERLPSRAYADPTHNV